MAHYIHFFSSPCPEEAYEIVEKAFVSYPTPILLEKDAHFKAWAVEGVSWELSLGIYENHQLIGLILHADTGGGCLKNVVTGLLPAQQGRGLLHALYPSLFSTFRAKGFQRITLEVLALNLKAVSCYTKIGFRITRRMEENSVLKFEMVKLI